MKRCEHCGKILWQKTVRNWHNELRAAEELRWGVFSSAMAGLTLLFFATMVSSKKELVFLLLFFPMIFSLTGCLIGVVKLIIIARRYLK